MEIKDINPNLRSYLKYLKGDPVIWIITILMMAFSLVTVYSFVPILVKIEGGTPFQYLFKHFIYVLLGFASMFFIHRVDSKYIYQLSKFAYYIALALLLFTIFFGAKLALILYISRLLVRKKELLNDWEKGIVPLMIPILLICGLIIKDNFSTAAMLFLLSMAMLFIGRVPFLKLTTLAAGGIGLVALVIGIHVTIPQLNLLPRYDTWVSRFNQRVENDMGNIANAQANNAQLAIHNGSLFGQGVGDGKLKEYLPEAYADFYYASFVEEFGLFSSFFLVLLYLILLFRIIRISLKTDDLFQTYASMGIGVHLLTQASINMLVCTGVFPVTGQNMPFLAMGGSALIMACISIGVIQSFSNQLQKGKKEEEGVFVS